MPSKSPNAPKPGDRTQVNSRPLAPRPKSPPPSQNTNTSKTNK
jgi:hypothetical protein